MVRFAQAILGAVQANGFTTKGDQDHHDLGGFAAWQKMSNATAGMASVLAPSSASFRVLCRICLHSSVVCLQLRA